MNDVCKLVISLSLSGSLLILVLLLCKPLFKNRVSKRWQYYIWLVVIARLLLPFAPKGNLMETLFDGAEQAVERIGETTGQIEGMEPAADQMENMERTEEAGQTAEQGSTDSADGVGGDSASSSDGALPAENGGIQEYQNHGIQEAGKYAEYLWLVWLGAAVILVVRKITIYQSFVKYVKSGWREVSDIALLDMLSEEEERLGIKRPVELYTNEQVPSPLLIGLFHPSIILPSADLPEADFRYTVRHELIHYRYCDVLYKWLVQITVCLHWFNPLVWLMGKETANACELACDEAVMKTLNEEERRTYGDVLLRAAGNKSTWGEAFASVTLSESGKLLKERLGAIGHFKKKSKMITTVSVISAVVLMAGAVMTGAAAPSGKVEVGSYIYRDEEVVMETLEFRGTEYYLVLNEAQLRAIGTGEYGLDKNYMQQADIQMSEREWIPIGTQNKPFTGSYNGNGFEITGLTITDPDVEPAGMFGVAHNAHIYNITMRDFDIVKSENIAEQPDFPILAWDMGGSRVYDNFVYLADENATEIMNSTSGRDSGMNAAGVAGTDSNEDEPEIAVWNNSKAASETPAGGNGMSSSSKAEEYYENGSLPGFGRAFYELDAKEQEAWLNRAYHDEEIAFFSVALQQLDAGSALFETFAQKAYADENVSFFSVLTNYMSKDLLERWLDESVADRKFGFQSVLYTALDRDWEKEAMEEELDRQREEEYKSVGVTKDGKKYYYQGQLVGIFLDMKPDSAFHTLDMNPEGTVNIKIVRDAAGMIESVTYMTEEEVKERFGEAQVVRPPDEASDEWDDATYGPDEWE